MAVGVLQIEFVVTGAVRVAIGIKDGEDHREVVVGVSVSETDFHAKVVCLFGLNLNTVKYIIEALPRVVIKTAVQNYPIIRFFVTSRQDHQSKRHQ